MNYYQLPNKLEWYKDLVEEAQRKKISLRVLCEVAGISYESLKHAAVKMRETGTGLSYETLVTLTDILNGMEGNPNG